jgi:hypothetical protein
LQNVAQDVNGLGHVLIKALGVVYGLLSRGVGVKVGADVLDFELERGLVAGLGALEGEVLNVSTNPSIALIPPRRLSAPCSSPVL